MKENQIQIFSNPNLGEVRVSVTPNNEPMFCLADLCAALGISNHRNVRARLDDDDVRQMDATDNLGRTQLTTFVTEAGMYDVILRSDAPAAKPFRKWVTSEVLPTIRKSGGYIATKADDTPEEIMARALQIANATLAKREARIQQLEAVNEEQVKQLSEAAPKVSYYDTTLQSVNTLTTTQIAKELGLDAPKLNQRLKAAGVLFRQSGMWMLRQPYSTMGLTATRTQTYTRSDGSTGTSMYTVWTERGRHFIHTLNIVLNKF